MTIVDCHADIVAFHSEQVVLSKDEQDEMRGRRDAGRTRLKSGLQKMGKPQPSEIVTQGSYAMRTMIQDPELDYDIDDGVYFRRAELVENGAPMASRRAREMVRDALNIDERLKLKAVARDNCVRQQYPEGYHIDMPVYRDANAQPPSELASKDAWISSDGRAVTKWFNDIVGVLNTGEPDGSQMRRVVRLTKKYARSRIPWKSQVTTGICMTKLVVDNFVAANERDDESLFQTWTAIRGKLAASLRVAHPVIPGGTISKGDNDPEVAFFRDRLIEALQTLAPIVNPEFPRSEALKRWDLVFNTKFFSGRPGSGAGGGGGAPVVVTSKDVPSRNDGDRRFG